VKRYVLVAVGVVLVGIGVLVALYVYTTRTPPTLPPDLASAGYVKTMLRFGDVVVVADVADTQAKLTQGLSGRRELREGTGMLFVMSYPSRHGFWMKDMYLTLDIVWLDEYLEVIEVTARATPDSYPQTFRPTRPALYVLEVPGGYAEKVGIVPGMRAEIVSGA
jgi:uncharacterized membrane protein (UPF0127 family)